MFGKRRNALISASLGSTATTVTHHPFSPKIRHMHPINPYQPLSIWCTWRNPTQDPAHSSSRAWTSSSWNWKQLKTYEGYEKKKVPRGNVLKPQQTITNNRIIGTISGNHILRSSWYHSGDERSNLFALHKGFAVSRQKQESDVLWIFWMIFPEI